MYRRLALVRSDISEKSIACIIRVKTISEPVTVASVLIQLVFIRSVLQLLLLLTLFLASTSVLTRATRRHVPQNGILHDHRRENLKSYTALTGWAL
jgi:hypothetical protein